MEYDIFISYSHSDKDLVEGFIHALENKGYSCWHDHRVHAGETFREKIIKAIKGSHLMVFFSSSSANESEYTTKEILYANYLKRPIIPVKLDDSEYNDEVLFDLNHIHYIDYTRRNPEAIKGLLETLQAIIPKHEPESPIISPVSSKDASPIINRIISNMVYVEGGTFSMGASLNDKESFDNEKPKHRVNISSFHIGRYTVTQEEWEEVMGNNPSSWKGEKFPVEKVTYNDCQEFIKKLNKLTGKKFRLPTEAEWEYAARGGSKSMDYLYSGSNNLSEVGWYLENSGNRPHEVGKRLPNELGLYDMSGNVYEWCEDWYDANFYKKSRLQNPAGPVAGVRRVARGGSWRSKSKYSRITNRAPVKPGYGALNIGLRLAL